MAKDATLTPRFLEHLDRDLPGIGPEMWSPCLAREFDRLPFQTSLRPMVTNGGSNQDAGGHRRCGKSRLQMQLLWRGQFHFPVPAECFSHATSPRPVARHCVLPRIRARLHTCRYMVDFSAYQTIHAAMIPPPTTWCVHSPPFLRLHGSVANAGNSTPPTVRSRRTPATPTSCDVLHVFGQGPLPITRR
jgi:hypothetical protein